MDNEESIQFNHYQPYDFSARALKAIRSNNQPLNVL